MSPLRFLAVEAVYCELVSGFPPIREEYRVFLKIRIPLQKGNGELVALINGLQAETG